MKTILLEDIIEDLSNIYIDKRLKKKDFIIIEDINNSYEKSFDAMNDLNTMGYMKKNKGKCLFYKNNKCWVEEDDNYIERYFSYNEEKDELFFLNLTDFYKVFLNTTNLNKVFKSMFKDYNIKVKEEEWKEMNRKTINYNLEVISSKKIKNDFFNLNRIIGGNLLIMQEFLIESIDKIRTQEESYNNKAIINISNRYLVDSMKNKGKDMNVSVNPSIISKTLNMYCLLGLIRKVRKNEMPEIVYNTEKERTKKSNVGTNIFRNAYVINKWTIDLLTNAEKIAKICRRNKITVSSINFDKILDAFGPQTALAIYGDTRQNTVKALNNREQNKNNSEILNNIKDIDLPF